MKAQFSMLSKLQNDLKQYQGMFTTSIGELSKSVENLPEDQKQFVLSLQGRIQLAMTKGDQAEVMKVREELMNYLKENGTNNTSNQ